VKGNVDMTKIYDFPEQSLIKERQKWRDFFNRAKKINPELNFVVDD
jgi:hypothetical protein